MQVDDLGFVEPALEADVCIVGSGPAGLTIARELAGSGLDVLVLESGGRTRSAAADALNEIESIGAPRVLEQWHVRNRMLGGSSHTWAGRCAPFQPIDFETREWVAHSGWPIERAELVPYLDRAGAHLGLALGAGLCDGALWAAVGRPRPQPTDARRLRSFYWQISQDRAVPADFMRFGNHVADAAAPNVRVLVNATLTRLHRRGDRIDRLDVRSPDGHERTVRADRVVLCCGGIENARVLLASGIGNDLVGRYLMDHRVCVLGSFGAGGVDTTERYGYFDVDDHRILHGLALAPDVQREEKLLNCAVWTHTTEFDRYLPAAVTRLRRGGWAHELRAGLSTRRGQVVDLLGIVEQQPDPDSRVLLSERTDALGVPLSRLDWRVHELEDRTMARTIELVREEFSRLGITQPRWQPLGGLVDVAHATGTTRMSADPDSGVVDVDCRVHGTDNLYVVGSSVFPTASHANPTHMIVAMAVRAADLLRCG